MIFLLVVIFESFGGLMRIFVLSFVFIITAMQSAIAAPPPIEAYAQLPAVYDGALSPDGNKLAVIVENDGKYIIRVFNLADLSDKTIRATPIPANAMPEWVKWVNNDRLLLSLEGTDKIGNTIANTGFLLTISGDMSDADILIQPGKKELQAAV